MEGERRPGLVRLVVPGFPGRPDGPAFIEELRGTRGSEKHVSSPRCRTWDQYRLFLDTVAYALYHALYGSDVISRWLVVPKPHHLPPFHNGVPVYFNNPVFELFPRGFHPKSCDGRWSSEPRTGKKHWGDKYTVPIRHPSRASRRTVRSLPWNPPLPTTRTMQR